ncbi:(d)CMP kinase [Mycoplasma iguanae]|uniref:Cytidylate kinase n=1 Tax=Mycoplasma iguanae TaxID=292461 RepID=A0ABY5R7L9_9MOLU|nr:(d)CMP kinase [Mycoplasma iguanae]
MKKINIAIDGPSGAGKSTIAKMLAKNLNYFFVNTGSLYRGLAYFLHKNKIDLKNETLIEQQLEKINLTFDMEERIFVNGLNLTKELRSDEVSLNASQIAQYSKVREKIVEVLKKFVSENSGIIMDGRDTTFVIMPEAELKIFLWASPEERAKRRVIQNKTLGYEEDYFQVLKEIKDRDFTDMNRKTNPLHKTEDAILIDSTNLTETEVFQEILALAKKKCME